MTAPARFGRLAHLYRWMEYFSFGPYLAECRMFRVHEAASRKSALVYGDGDGRFLARLASAAPEMPIVAVDASDAMLREAARRLPREHRVRLVHADALGFRPAEAVVAPFDTVTTHFFLDCLTMPEVEEVVALATEAAAPEAIWIVSEFAIPPRAPMHQVASAIVGALYVAFGVLTGLHTHRLPDHGRALRAAGWQLEDRRELLAGLLISERWRRCA